MQDKICMVTGSNAGIGKATALGLARQGATVVMVCRSRERGAATQAEIKQKSGNDEVALLLADLSSQAQIRQLAAQFKQSYKQLHVLVNNAAVVPHERELTVDGLEMQWAVNHLAYFLLTNLLLDVLKASAPARIVNVSSTTHQWASLDFDNLNAEKGYDPQRAYGQTKLANMLFTYELARRLEGSGVTVNALHPGVIATKLNAGYMGRSRVSDASDAALERGARTILYLASSPQVEEVTGKYFVNEREARSSAVSYDKELARRLWQVSAEQTGTNHEP